MATDFKLVQRAYIKIRTLLGLSPSDIPADLQMVYKDNSASYSNVKYWAKRFRDGQEPLEDGFGAVGPNPSPLVVISLKLSGWWKRTLI